MIGPDVLIRRALPGRRDVLTGRPGDGTLLRRYAGDWRSILEGTSIGILQLMYPPLGAAVAAQSGFFEDPYGRIYRSIPQIWATLLAPDADEQDSDLAYKRPEQDAASANDPRQSGPFARLNIQHFAFESTPSPNSPARERNLGLVVERLVPEEHDLVLEQRSPDAGHRVGVELLREVHTRQLGTDRPGER